MVAVNVQKGQPNSPINLLEELENSRRHSALRNRD